MTSRPIDFQRMIDLDPKIAEQLERYLSEKENRLSYQIIHALSDLPEESSKPLLPAGYAMKISEAVDAFAKQWRMRSSSKGDGAVSADKCHQVVKEINRAFWEYTEVLEGSVVELFQQIRQVPLDRWHLSLPIVAHDVKELLQHRMEDLIWALRRIEGPLNEFCRNCEKASRHWFEWLYFWRSAIDPHLLKNLQKTERFLNSRFTAFKHRYNDYLMLNFQVEESLEKMKSYPILALLDIQEQNVYVDVYRLLKLLELTPPAKKELSVEATRALKILTGIDHVLRVFKKYFSELQEAYFSCSLEWKSFNHEEMSNRDSLDKLKAKVGELQVELQQFMLTMSRYRTFILKNDANPYVRSSWGFTEWTVAAEPEKAKELIKYLYAAEELDLRFARFKEALERDAVDQQTIEYHAHEEIEKLLHEMGQPLISRSMMADKAEALLQALQECDEAGSPQASTIFYFEDVLSKALRFDWKYHVLHDLPLFHQIYRIHQGLEEAFDDPAHAFRMEHFQTLFSEIYNWVKKGEVYSHVSEIELNMNDIKAYLQDFLASIQRVAKDKTSDPSFEDAHWKFRQQLLEYRYQFGQFLSDLLKIAPDGQQLRQQFLFVDQYFETIENQLNELKT